MRKKHVRYICPQTSKSEKMEGEEVLQVPEQRFCCSLWRTP